MLESIFGRNAKIPVALQSVTPEELLKQPIVQGIVDQLETQALEKRRKLIAELPEVSEEKEAAAAAKATRTCDQAAQDLRNAEAALRAAREKSLAAQAAASAAASPIRARRMEIERELEQSADPRIEQFRMLLLDLRDNRFYETYRFQFEKAVFGTRTVSNIEDIERARAQLSEALADVNAMLLEALSRADVTARLQTWSDRLRPVLAGIDLNPPKVEEHAVSHDEGLVRRDKARAEREQQERAAASRPKLSPPWVGS